MAKTRPSGEKYQPKEIEKKWQDAWEKEGLYQAKDFDKRKKFYTLIEFPYPSGAGLHVGHVRSWSAMDAYSRKKRMEGYNVLYPIGWDAFGLPAENYAIKNKIHPSVAVEKNIANFKRQIKSLGLSFDWSREINTTAPKYYKWTQWIFLKFFEKGLAFLADVAVNWCPFCKTNLADEEVLPDGKHERCGNQTEKRMQKQWLLKITAYAERLLEDLKLVDYSPKIAIQQVNWIGRKEGINITYSVIASEAKQSSDSGQARMTEQGIAAPRQGGARNDIIYEITCFTTRPDTNFGATFIVIGPEHPFVAKLFNSEFRIQNSELGEIRGYVERAKKKSETDRIVEGRKKTGVFTGFYAINNLNGKKMPIWISDFVLGNVGTGAVVGVPGHDKRDYQFAREFNLLIEVVVLPDKNSEFRIQNSELQFKIKNEWVEGAYEGDGVVINSSFIDDLNTEEAKIKIMDYLEEKGWGKRVVHYHLRDWVFSRQHYWGEPIPIIYCANCAINKISNIKYQISNKRSKDENSNEEWIEGKDYRIIDGKEYAMVPVPEKDLPVELPYLEQYEPSGTGESPLAKVEEWVNVVCPVCGSKARRETDTMPNWAGSNWYYLAYLFADVIARSEATKQSQADGIATPAFGEARNDGNAKLIEENIFEENRDRISYWMPVDIYQGGFEHTTLHLLYSRFVHKFLYDIGVVNTPEPYAKRRSHGIVLGPDGRKMSKSFGNVINPDDIAGKLGADTLRVYEMFMGPFDQTIAWSEESVEGCFRFLKRVWQLSLTKVSDSKTSVKLLAKLHKTIKKVGEDLDGMKFNTAVAAMMEFINDWQASPMGGQADKGELSKEDLEKFLLILAPFAPHLTEELYQRIMSQELGIMEKRGKNHHSSFIIHNSIHAQPWPSYDPKLLTEGEVTIAVLVNGKVRNTIKYQISNIKYQISNEEKKKQIEQMARESANVQRHLEGKEIKKVIYVEGKIINFVTS